MYKIIGADGRVYGPVSAGELREWIVEGRANGQSQIQAEGSPDWRPLETFPEFASALAGAASRTPPALPVLAEGSVASTKTNGLAIAGFILGLVSVPAFCCCCCNPPCAVLGLIFSSIGLAQINRNPMQGGKGLAIAGIILSVLGLVAFVLSMIFGAANRAFDPSFFQ